MFTGHRGISASWSNQLLITAEVSWGIKKSSNTITLLWHSVSRSGWEVSCALRGRIQKQGWNEEKSEPVGSSHNKFFIVFFPLAYLWQSRAQRGAVIFSVFTRVHFKTQVTHILSARKTRSKWNDNNSNKKVRSSHKCFEPYVWE